MKVKYFNSSLRATLASSFEDFIGNQELKYAEELDFLHRSRICDLHGEGVSKYWGKVTAQTVWKLLCFLFLLSPFSLYR